MTLDLRPIEEAFGAVAIYNGQAVRLEFELQLGLTSLCQLVATPSDGHIPFWRAVY
jgi:hypothetical protein